MHNQTALETLIEDGFILEKEGIRLFKDPNDSVWPYKVDVQQSAAKGRVSDGGFSTLDLAIPCFIGRSAALQDLHASAAKRLKTNTSHDKNL